MATTATPAQLRVVAYVEALRGSTRDLPDTPRRDTIGRAVNAGLVTGRYEVKYECRTITGQGRLRFYGDWYDLRVTEAGRAALAAQ